MKENEGEAEDEVENIATQLLLLCGKNASIETYHHFNEAFLFVYTVCVCVYQHIRPLFISLSNIRMENMNDRDAKANVCLCMRVCIHTG